MTAPEPANWAPLLTLMMPTVSGLLICSMLLPLRLAPLPIVPLVGPPARTSVPLPRASPRLVLGSLNAPLKVVVPVWLTVKVEGLVSGCCW